VTLYTYNGPSGKLHGYTKKYKKHLLRRKGFATKGDAERDLRRAMDDIDAELRGETRVKPTTMQDAHDIFRRNLEVRAKDKPYQYRYSIKHLLSEMQNFVDHFGPERLVRECTDTDLREFYQMLCFRISRNSAGMMIGRVQGMLKAAQRTRPDLINWIRPNLKVSRKTEHERRVVTDFEYATLIDSLLHPPVVKRKNQYDVAATRRDAADVVQLLRLTGGRLNEIVRIRLDQFEWARGTVLLFASKTENERRVPLVKTIIKVVRARISEGLTDAELVFPRSRVMTYDKRIAHTCHGAGRAAKLDYGIENGFSLHSLRHTFITSMMQATNNDAGTVMSWSGHKTLQSFSIYLQPTDHGRILGIQALEAVDPFLILSAGNQGQQGNEGKQHPFAKIVYLK
jgi:integrase